MQGGEGSSSRQQQQLRAGPELRLRLDSQDAESGRSVKALVTVDSSPNGARLEKVSGQEIPALPVHINHMVQMTSLPWMKVNSGGSSLGCSLPKEHTQ